MSHVHNSKVTLHYAILERFEAGIQLLGFEVKSIRAGHGQLDGSRVVVRGGEAFLVGATIPAFQKKNAPTDYDESRTRKLLLQKPQLAHIYEACEQNGLTAVPLSLYSKKTFIKCEVAIVRGKKKQDKRETLKKRDAERERERITKSQRA